MADLDTLRPEVREAVHAIDHGNGVFVDSDDSIGAEKWRIVLTELLRLADENETLERAASKHVLRCTELQAILDTVLPKECAASERAEKAEDELAALKARIANSTLGTLDVCYNGHAPAFVGFPDRFEHDSKQNLIGKRVRLVVEE